MDIISKGFQKFIGIWLLVEFFRQLFVLFACGLVIWCTVVVINKQIYDSMNLKKKLYLFSLYSNSLIFGLQVQLQFSCVSLWEYALVRVTIIKAIIKYIRIYFLIASGVTFYFWLAALAHFKELKEKDTNISTVINKQTT